MADTTTTAATGTSEGTTASGAGTAAATTAAAPWHGLTDAEAAAYVGNKGWQSPADVIKSYQGAEKLLGRDPSTLVTLPRADDPEGRRALLGKLGVPETPDKYEFDNPKDTPLDEAYMGFLKQTFHKLGIPAAEAKELTKAHNEYIQAQIQKEIDDYNLRVDTDRKALADEWKGGQERMMNRAKTAATALGFTPEVVDAIEHSIGYAATMKLFAEIGGKLGEDSLVIAGDKNNRFSETMTPAEAKAAWEATKLDENFTKALLDASHPGHKAAVEKQKKLFSIMHPEG